MPLVILHHLLNVSVQLANKRGLNKLSFLSFYCYSWNFYNLTDKSIMLNDEGHIINKKSQTVEVISVESLYFWTSLSEGREMRTLLGPLEKGGQ
jgi:hypothetical protein